jgi:hypothetical protein
LKNPKGIIGAALWVPASILSIFAINYLGLSIAVGIWAGVTSKKNVQDTKLTGLLISSLQL